MNAQQMQFLQSSLDMPLVANQLELHLLKLDWLDDIVLANHDLGVNVNFGSGSIEYCRANNVQVQSWGSLCQGWLSGRSLDGQTQVVQQTAQRVAQLAAEYQTSAEAIILGFLRRHPASIQPVIGTTDIDRIAACAKVNDIELSRGHWYSLYVTARGQELP
jgi:predicted oxidoreductase